MTSISINENANLALVALDARGNTVTPVTFDAPPTWTNSDDTAATLSVSPDGTTAVLTSVATGGTTAITVTASVAGTAFSGTATVVIVAGAVASLTITVTPVPKP